MEDFILLTGTANPKLAKDVGHILGKEVLEPVTFFADGEVRVRIPENIRRRHVHIIQPTSKPTNDNLMELIFMIDAAKRASANEITAVIPYFGYSRQDRKEMPRVPVSASVVANMLVNAGANRIVTVDIHSEQQQGSVSVPWDNLYASYILLPELRKMNTKKMVIASPDKGGVERATAYAKRLSAQGIAIVFKQRDIQLNNESMALDYIGEIEGKEVLLVDDMIDTGGTIANAADLLMKHGAKCVFIAATHGVFSKDALAKLATKSVAEIFVTDTIAQPEEVIKNKKIQIVSVAPLLAHAIECVQTGLSISKDLHSEFSAR